MLANAVAHAAGDHGLAYLAGTSPDVGIVGYTLGGALCVGSPGHGCLDTIDEPFLFFTFGIAGDPAMKEAVEQHVELLLSRLEPWNSGRRYLNLTESQADPRTIFPEASWERLQQVKATYDPGELFLANHCIPVAVSAKGSGDGGSTAHPVPGRKLRSRGSRSAQDWALTFAVPSVYL